MTPTAVNSRGEHRLAPGGRDEALRAEVVDLLRLSLLERLDERGLVEQVGLDERDPVRQVLDSLEVLGRRRRTMPCTS